MGRHSAGDTSLPERSEHDDDSDGTQLLPSTPPLPAEPAAPIAPSGQQRPVQSRRGPAGTGGYAATRSAARPGSKTRGSSSSRGSGSSRGSSKRPAGKKQPGQRLSGPRALARKKWAKPGAALVSVAALAGLLSLVGGGAASGAANVVANSTFDSGLQGWYVNPGTILTSVPGHSGAAAQISQNGPGNKTIVLNDTVNTVQSTVSGALYSAEAWVRSTAPNTSVSLRLMEYQGSTNLRGQGKTSIWLTDTNWHQMHLSYYAVSAGSSLDLNVLGNQVAPGVGVDIDDVTLLDPAASSGPVVPPPVPTTTTVAPTVAPTTVAPSPSPKPTTKSPTVAPTTSKPPTTAPATTAPSAPAGWHEVWGDEFNGNSIDRSNWAVLNDSTYGEGNKELECSEDRPENIREGGGVLTMTALHEATPVKCSNNDPRFPNGRSYTSAHMSTKGLHEWTYGRFEMRAKLPVQQSSSKGLWPAFWLRPTDGGTGELDILEAIGSTGAENFASTVYQTLHYDYIGTYPQQGFAYKLPSGVLSDGYHTYAAEWEKGVIRFYVDGKLTETKDQSTTPWLDSAFNKPFYIRINMAVGGNWPGSPDASTKFPANYDVDWVRVFQR